MPINYVCDWCQVAADSLDGWNIVDVNFCSTMNTPTEGTRVLDSTETFYFHAKKCRDDWAAKAGVEPPQGPAQ